MRQSLLFLAALVCVACSHGLKPSEAYLSPHGCIIGIDEATEKNAKARGKTVIAHKNIEPCVIEVSSEWSTCTRYERLTGNGDYRNIDEGSVNFPCPRIRWRRDAEFEPFAGAVEGASLKQGHRYVLQADYFESEEDLSNCEGRLHEGTCEGENTLKYKVLKVLSDTPAN